MTENLVRLVSTLDITGGDERKIGYYAGLIVEQIIIQLRFRISLERDVYRNLYSLSQKR